MKTKKCSTCRTEKSLGDFHADLRSKDGRQATCRDCRKTPKPVLTFDDYISKTCTKCGVSKLRENFWKDNRGRDGLRPRCITCSQEYKKGLLRGNK